VKRSEALFGPDDTVRGRIIWNPSDEMKPFLGCLGNNLLKAAKAACPSIACGMTPEMLDSMILRLFRSVPSAMMISMDGAAHDAAMRAWLLKMIDCYILSKLGYIVCLRAGMTPA